MTDRVAVAFLVAAAVAGVALALLFRWRTHLPLAQVNARTLHAIPIPRVGGLALWAGFLPALAVAGGPAWFPPTLWLGPWSLLFLVSLRDDVRSVGVAARFAVHALAAGWLAWSLAQFAGLPPWSAFVVFAVAGWSLNLYNFMDGSDGLALAMALVGFAAYAIVLGARGDQAAIAVALCGAVLPVLAVNRPRARMFIGDVGAVPLGFLAAAVGCAGVAAGVFAAWFPPLVFLPFILDATVTLARRTLRRERFWESHKSHYYQRLLQLGAGHGGTLAVYAALMAGCAGTAVACALAAPQWGWPALVAWCALHAGLFATIDYHWRRSAPTT